MGFCEKPSRGCAACRAKKKRCDEARPSCSLCLRTNRKCTGYRDRLDLGFRDEKSQILHKIRRQKGTDDGAKEPSKGSDTTNTATSGQPPRNQPVPRVNTVVCIPTPSMGLAYPSARDQARSFFFHHYVFTDLAAPYSLFASLPTIYGRLDMNSGGDDGIKAIAAVIEAIGAAGIANTRQDARFLRAAQETHSKAIRHTRCVLENSQHEKQDEVGLAVMLLALYENMTCSMPESMRSWSKHVQGATALLSLRGDNPAVAVHDKTSLQLFLYLRQQIITDCLQRKVPVPPIILQIATTLDTQTAWSPHALEALSTKLCALRSAVRLCSLPPSQIIDEALDLDARLEAWVSAMPADEYAYTILHDFEHPDDVFFGRCHVYKSANAVVLWNHYRCVRLLTREVLLKQLTTMTADSCPIDVGAHARSSKETIDNMVADICSSIPLYLGSYRQSHHCPPAAGNGGWPHGMMGMLLLWPLYTCATHTFSSPSVRSWVIRQLQRIGRDMGIQLAMSLAGLLSAMDEVTVWDRMQPECTGREGLASLSENEDW